MARLREQLIDHSLHLHGAVGTVPSLRTPSGMLKATPAQVRNIHLLSLLMARDGKVETARLLIEAALRMAPGDPRLVFHAARIFEETDSPTQATGYYQRSLALDPRNQHTRFHMALNLLGMGRLAEGAALYASRPTALHANTSIRRLPRWDGTPRDGRVLLWAEQGVGDEIMFLRFLSVIPELHGMLVVEVDRRLRPLYERNFPQVCFQDRGTPFRAKDYCAQAAIGDLLCLFHARMGQPGFAAHALSAPAGDRAARRPVRLGASVRKKIIGISWLTMSQVHALERSIAIDEFLQAFDPDRHALVNLQYLAPPEDLDHIRQRGFELLVTPGLDCHQDLCGLAALISELDQVVCIDNSTAHLAGSVGQDVLVLLPRLANWRWPEGDKPTLWYPRVTTVRQQEARNWQQVLWEVRSRLSGH